MKFALVVFVSFQLCIPSITVAQREPVQWKISIDSSSGNVRYITFDASVSPGWHLYSQYIEEGGPIPTSFSFNENLFAAIGKATENGKRVTFYDEIYGMNVSWYSERATFVQTIEIEKTISSVSGFIDYMACNGEVCVPSKKSFSISVGFNRK